MQATTALIIDCGSGFTRAAVFSRNADGLIRSCEAHSHAGLPDPWRQRKVVDALVEGGAALREWVASMQALIDATGCAKTVVGTTGGLRQAVADGLVTPAMLAALVALLRELAPSATFMALSGDDEARAELAAVQHVAEAALPAAAARPMGMLSGGGMSCQVGWHERGSSVPSLLSLTPALNTHSHALKARTCLTADSDGGDGDVRRIALKAFQANLAAEVEATGRRGKLRGTFCCIEMVGALGSAQDYAGSFAGGLADEIGSRLVSKQVLVGALESHLERWQAQRGPMAHAYYEAYAGLLPAELLGLTALCDDEATFYVCRGFEVAPGELLKPSWSLGVFVNGL